jgi:hypothetical protein
MENTKLVSQVYVGAEELRQLHHKIVAVKSCKKILKSRKQHVNIQTNMCVVCVCMLCNMHGASDLNLHLTKRRKERKIFCFENLLGKQSVEITQA